MSRCRVVIAGALLCAFASCRPDVSVGSDADLGEGPRACELVAVPTISCPEVPWGKPRLLDSIETLEGGLLGRWAFCGGEKQYTGTGPLSGFPHGAGVEFWSDAGQLRYAFLVGTPGRLARAEDSTQAGTLRLKIDNGRGRALLLDGKSREFEWNIDLFDEQHVLQNAAFDVWNFVLLE